MSNNYEIWNEDCILGAKSISDKSVHLLLADPPFGIQESKFDNLYNRNFDNVISGYVEAPQDYDKFTLDWMTEAKRVLDDNGSMYIVSGWTNLPSIFKAIEALNLFVVNHIVWKFNFGVNTKNKYVSSHYHIIYLTKSKKAKRTFNSNCRFTQLDKDDDGGSLLYQDLEDVWVINKEYQPQTKKNVNKLPNKLVNKIIEYSSNAGDLVCDFFMGNFTTAYCSLELGRRVTGFELNPESYEHHIDKISKIKCENKVVNITPKENPYFNQGKKLTDEEVLRIKNRFTELKSIYKSKKDVINKLTFEFGRGRFSINNILNS